MFIVFGPPLFLVYIYHIYQVDAMLQVVKHVVAKRKMKFDAATRKRDPIATPQVGSADTTTILWIVDNACEFFSMLGSLLVFCL